MRTTRAVCHNGSQLPAPRFYAPEVDLGRGAIVKSLMDPFLIVNLEVPTQSALRNRNAVALVQEHLLVFDRAPQPLDEDVVEQPAAAIHADPNALALEPAGERFAGELRALVAIEDRRATARQGASDEYSLRMKGRHFSCQFVGSVGLVNHSGTGAKKIPIPFKMMRKNFAHLRL